MSWYFIGEIRLIEIHETKLRVPIFFSFFQIRVPCSRSIDWRGDRFFIFPDWIYTRAGIARGCYIKNEFSRPMLSTMVRCARFFFHYLELLVTYRVVDNRWRQELNENHWHLEIEFSLKDTFHYYINGLIWIILSFYLSFFFYFVHAWVFEWKLKKHRNCLIITVSLYIVNVLLVDFCVKNYSHILLYLYFPILFFIFDESWENRYYSFFFFFYRYLGNWETIVNYDKSLFISTGQKDK